MGINTIERSRDVINNLEDLEKLDNFENYPVFMGCVDQPLTDDILADMQWSISKNSGVIQLNPLIPLEILYPEDHGAGVVGSLWLEHHQKICKIYR